MPRSWQTLGYGQPVYLKHPYVFPAEPRRVPEDDNPVGSYRRSFDVPDLDDHVLPIGNARIVREGKDATIVTYSIGVGLALEAAETLAAEGIDAEVIDLRTLRPLDKQAVLTSLAKTNRLVVGEEGWPTCSIASEIIAICMEEGFDDLDAPVLRVCNEDVPLPYAANLEKLALIDAAKIAEAVRKVCYV